MKERIRELLKEIASRAPKRTVTLVAVSKTVGPNAIRTAYDAGLRNFGENRVDALLEKQDALSELTDINWHFIGHVQRNKVRKIVGKVNLIHSVDSIRLLQEIDKVAKAQNLTQDVLLQFNTSGESSKQGFEIQESEALLQAAVNLQTIRLKGLMTMAPFLDDELLLRKVFQRLNKLMSKLTLSAKGKCNAGGLPLFEGMECSMGMTNDYKYALDEGATLLRIGTGIFGGVR